MSTFFKIPLYPKAQHFTITLSGTTYQLLFRYRDAPASCAGGQGWVMDIFDEPGNRVVCGVPLVTGTNLLGQYAYLGFGGGMMVYTEGDPSAVPGYNDLGVHSLLYWVTTP